MAKQNTSTDTASKTRTLSDNDRAIIRRSYTALLGVLGSYLVGEDGSAVDVLPTDVDSVIRSKHLSQVLADRTIHAVGVIRREERKARLAALRTEVEGVLNPLIAAQRTMWEGQRTAYDTILQSVKGNQMAEDLLKKSLPTPVDHTDIPVATLQAAVRSFPPGTTLQQIGDVLTEMGYKVVSSRGRNATLSLHIPFVAPSAPKSVPQLRREMVADDDIFAPTTTDKEDNGDGGEESAPVSHAAE